MRPVLLAAAFAVASFWAAKAEPSTGARAAAFLAALERNEPQELAGFFAPDVVTTLPFAASGETDPGAYRVFNGRAQTVAYFGGAAERIPEVAFVDVEITVSEDGATAFIETRGAMRLADGAPYRNLYVWRLDFEGEAIVGITEYLNPVTAALAFGRPIGPQPAE